MFIETRYFLRLSLRHLFKKQLGYTLINITGLAVGFATILIAGIYSYDELNYDRFHPNSERVYRLVVDWDGDGVKRNWARSSVPVGRVGDGDVPEIEQLVRVRKNPGTDLLTIANQSFYESQLLMVESGFFDLFGFKLMRGEINKVLSDKFSIVLNERTAKKYFGDQDPLGKVIRYDGRFDLTVTGVVKNPPTQSHIQFDCLLSFNLLDEMFSEGRLNHWGQFDHYTYLRTVERANTVDVETKMKTFLANQAPEWVNEKIILRLQPIHSIHLKSHRHSELSVNSSTSYSFVFITAAGLVLLLAIINYINLSAAIYMARTKEILMRKVLGSSKRNLLNTFITESIVLSITAMTLALLIMQFLLRQIGSVSGKDFGGAINFSVIGLALVIALITGLVSGIFPAVQLIKLQSFTTSILKKGKTSLSNIMILVQLAISSLLIIAMLGVSKQLSFMQSTSLGYKSDEVLIIPIKDRSQNSKYQTTINELGSISGVKSASFSSSTPGTNNSLTYTYKIQNANREEAAVSTVILDENYFDLYGIALKEGRFPDGKLTVGQAQIILNQAAVDFFELEEPIGKTVTGKVKGIIIGVVEDFQINSLHTPMEPLIMYNFLPTLRYVSVKPDSHFTPQVLDKITASWSSIYKNYPLEFSFLEDDNLRLYSFETGVLFSLDILVRIAVFIAAIGLMGHATLLRRRSAREYSIRKVLGGSSSVILLRIFKKFLPPLFIGSVVVISLGYWGLNLWLQNFAFRNSPNLAIYVLPILSMTILLILIVCGLLLKQLNQSPVKYLREM